MSETIRGIEFTRVKSDVNGNPRHVIHFLALNTREEIESMEMTISQKYNNALARGRKLGGSKVHNKQYGGGIIFSSYDRHSLANEIIKTRGW